MYIVGVRVCVCVSERKLALDVFWMFNGQRRRLVRACVRTTTDFYRECPVRVRALELTRVDDVIFSWSRILTRKPIGWRDTTHIVQRDRVTRMYILLWYTRIRMRRGRVYYYITRAVTARIFMSPGKLFVFLYPLARGYRFRASV